MIQHISFKSLVSFFTTKIYSAKYYKSQCSKDDIYVLHMTFIIIHIAFPKTSKGTKEPYDYKVKMEWVATLCQQLNYTIA